MNVSGPLSIQLAALTDFLGLTRSGVSELLARVPEGADDVADLPEDIRWLYGRMNRAAEE